MSTGELARAAYTSKATVVRLCQKLVRERTTSQQM